MKKFIFLIAASLFLATSAAQVNLSGKLSLKGKQNWLTTFSNLLHVNCVYGSVSCTTPNFSFDPPNNSSFSGYADPSIRQDPQTGTFWVAYSYPRVLTGGTAVVDIHVAYNSGSGWKNSGLTNNGVLFTTQTVTNGVTGKTDDQTSNEVITLEPDVQGGITYWYALHSQYLVPKGGSGIGQGYTLRQEFLGCAGDAVNGPMCLLTATPQWLGGSVVNQTYWPLNVNLSSLSLGAASDWREPTFAISGGTLYLFIETSNLNSYYQFSTPSPSTHLGSWTWAFVAGSSFATSTDANSICAYLNACSYTNYLSQAEYAVSHVSGDPGLCIDMLHITSGTKISSGILYLHLATISPPTFDNPIQVKSVIKSTDSAAVGLGSCGYDPNYTGGQIVVNKQTHCAHCPVPGSNYVYMQTSNLRP